MTLVLEKPSKNITKDINLFFAIVCKPPVVLFFGKFCNRLLLFPISAKGRGGRGKVRLCLAPVCCWTVAVQPGNHFRRPQALQMSVQQSLNGTVSSNYCMLSMSPKRFIFHPFIKKRKKKREIVPGGPCLSSLTFKDVEIG